jgi:hypothetical protein
MDWRLRGRPGHTHVVQTFEGTTDTTTSCFTVEDKWEISWNTPGPTRFTLLSPDGQIVAGTSCSMAGAFYQPKGGTYYLQVNRSFGGTVPWRVAVIEVADAVPSDAAAYGDMHMDFIPPSALPATPNSRPNPYLTPFAPSTNSIAAKPGVGGTPSAAPPAPTINLTDAQTAAVVMIEGDKAEGTGFLVQMPDGPAVVTNIHVIAGNPNVRILTNTGAQISIKSLKGASDRDLALFSIADDHYTYLPLNSTIGNSVQVGDDVITPGNSQGGEVVLSTHGSVLGVGPQRIEFSNPVYHGNSGGPVFQTKTGKVLGVVTEAIKVDTNNALDKSSFANQRSAITGPMRYFGLRLDTVPQWETYDPTRFLSETTFMEQFHQQSRCLDSYLNSSDKTDNSASSGGDDSDQPSSKLYLTDAKIVKADDQFYQQAGGGDASQRLDAFRGWVFSLDSIADSDMSSIQDMSNFYSFDQQRAREEISYRKSLKIELDSFGDDISRVQSLGHRSD